MTMQRLKSNHSVMVDIFGVIASQQGVSREQVKSIVMTLLIYGGHPYDEMKALTHEIEKKGLRLSYPIG